MFSYKINNPNNFSIDVKGDYYAIPFGHRCSSALACKYAHMRKFSLPFDWTIPLYPSKIQKVLENDFEDYIPDVRNDVFVNKYDFELAHFNEDIDAELKNIREELRDSEILYSILRKNISCISTKIIFMTKSIAKMTLMIIYLMKC